PAPRAPSSRIPEGMSMLPRCSTLAPRMLRLPPASAGVGNAVGLAGRVISTLCQSPASKPSRAWMVWLDLPSAPMRAACSVKSARGLAGRSRLASALGARGLQRQPPPPARGAGARRAAPAGRGESPLFDPADALVAFADDDRIRAQEQVARRPGRRRGPAA